jgi:hypothetical protein
MIHVDSKESLETEAVTIDEYLNLTCSDDMNEVIARGNDIAVYLARTEKMLADAKYWQDVAINTNAILVDETYKSMPTSTKNKLIDSMCQQENCLYTWIDRLNSACVHQLDWLRSVLSKGKEEMRLSKVQY